MVLATGCGSSHILHKPGVQATLLPAFIHTTTMDDDSTTATNLKHSPQDQLQEENNTRKDNNLPPICRHQTSWWPFKWDSKGRKQCKEDYGKLPTTALPLVHFWADPSHCVKVLGKHLCSKCEWSNSSINKGIVFQKFEAKLPLWVVTRSTGTAGRFLLIVACRF